LTQDHRIATESGHQLLPAKNKHIDRFGDGFRIDKYRVFPKRVQANFQLVSIQAGQDRVATCGEFVRIVGMRRCNLLDEP
jgi:hypothetical protein